ncbi:tissue alpha-L-fucosidase-like [Oscarella lobularis]|uniref:tissue alpha-L-fucosidase-like n=1 Tax=Oscarella lobularis TaxID=121494 RepID=UPI003313FF8C
MHCLTSVLALIVAAQVFGQYTPDWGSLDKRPIPEWFDDVKFGLMISYGIYSVPAWAPVGSYEEWYWHNLNSPGSKTQIWHNATYGPDFKYEDFLPMLKGELFDADEWADIFFRAGLKYFVPLSKHHDGYTLWPSKTAWNWNSVDTGPHRDIIGELTTALRKRGLHAGVYFSLYDWYHPLYRGPNPELYVSEVMWPQLMELVHNYTPDILWTDGDWEQTAAFWNSTEFLAWLYNESPVKDKIVVNDRWGKGTRHLHGGFYTEEYSSHTESNHKWEENSGIDIHSYGLNRNTPPDKYWSAEYLINLLVRSVAYGGNLCLNVGISADGKVPNIQAERLLAIGSWLNVTGEAIYNTTKYKTPEEMVVVGKNFVVVPNSNNVFGAVSPKGNTSSIMYLGTFSSYEECMKRCMAYNACNSFTWIGPQVVDGYKNECFGRNDSVWSPSTEANHTSGHKDALNARYTASKIQKGTIYAIIDSWPTGNNLTLSSPVPTSGTVVSLLGYSEPLKWNGTPGKAGISIDWPLLTISELPCMYQWAVKITNAT